MPQENPHVQIKHAGVSEDGNSRPKDTLINSRRSFLTNFGLGSIAASAALLVGAPNNRFAVAQTSSDRRADDKDKDEDKDKDD
jgi:hypothetical protein